MWLLATILVSTQLEHCRQHEKLCCAALTAFTTSVHKAKWRAHCSSDLGDAIQPDPAMLSAHTVLWPLPTPPAEVAHVMLWSEPCSFLLLLAGLEHGPTVSSLYLYSLKTIMKKQVHFMWFFLTGDLIHQRQKRPQPHVPSANFFSQSVNSSVLGAKITSHIALQQ